MNGLQSVKNPFMVRQAHHERVFSLQVLQQKNAHLCGGLYLSPQSLNLFFDLSEIRQPQRVLGYPGPAHNAVGIKQKG